MASASDAAAIAEVDAAGAHELANEYNLILFRMPPDADVHTLTASASYADELDKQGADLGKIAFPPRVVGAFFKLVHKITGQDMMQCVGKAVGEYYEDDELVCGAVPGAIGLHVWTVLERRGLGELLRRRDAGAAATAAKLREKQHATTDDNSSSTAGATKANDSAAAAAAAAADGDDKAERALTVKRELEQLAELRALVAEHNHNKEAMSDRLALRLLFDLHRCLWTCYGDGTTECNIMGLFE